VVHIDHPFLMIVRDRTTGQPLFYGRVMDPTS
jgi:serine protease inhibitor